MPADLNPSNRPVRTRMPGGVAGDAEANLRAPMPIGTGCASESIELHDPSVVIPGTERSEGARNL